MAGVPRTGLSPSAARLPRRLPLPSLLPRRPPCNPARASTPAVWAGPLSLAATRGVTVVFLSSGYLDVSVRRVRLRNLRMPCLRTAGFPIRASADPWLLAPPRGLSRPAAPFVAPGSLRHPPCALCRSLAAGHRCPRPLVLYFSVVFTCCLSGASRDCHPVAAHGAPRSVLLFRGACHAARSRVLLSSLSHPVNEPSCGPPRGCRPL